jgi:hypothetical protein
MVHRVLLLSLLLALLPVVATARAQQQTQPVLLQLTGMR